MLYFAVANYGFDGGMTISASHNPVQCNGIKMVRAGGVPISGDTGIAVIQELANGGYEYKAPVKGQVMERYIAQDYIEKCLSFIDKGKLKSYRIVANSMFGPALQNIRKMNLPVQFIPLNEELNGTFPKGQPDPMLESNRKETSELVLDQKADMGVAWDGDADRCFIFDETGRCIPGYYLTAFLAKHLVAKNPGAKVICDPRLTWAVLDDVFGAGGAPLRNKSGHSFIKERMRLESAVFAGESSGHFYFRDYFYCDNGLIPFLLVLEILSESGKKLSELFDRYFELYPISGEINIKLERMEDAKTILSRVEEKYADAAKLERVDGLSVEYPDWRANVRSSNTEPLIRLNVEAKNPKVLSERTKEILGVLEA
jgi:phosphomannomutase